MLSDPVRAVWDLASVALLVMCVKLVSRRYDWPSLGSLPSAAALAQVPASSLPSALWCAGVHQTAKVLLSLVIRSPNSRMAVARRYPGHMLSKRMRPTADAESEKMVYGPPLASRWSIIVSAL